MSILARKEWERHMKKLTQIALCVMTASILNTACGGATAVTEAVTTAAAAETSADAVTMAAETGAETEAEPEAETEAEPQSEAAPEENFVLSERSTQEEAEKYISAIMTDKDNKILEGADEHLFGEKEDVLFQFLSDDDLRIAFNEIYASHGRKFSDPDLQAYFDEKSWYEGTVEPDQFEEGVFNEYETKNLAYLNKLRELRSSLAGKYVYDHTGYGNAIEKNDSGSEYEVRPDGHGGYELWSSDAETGKMLGTIRYYTRLIWDDRVDGDHFTLDEKGGLQRELGDGVEYFRKK